MLKSDEVIEILEHFDMDVVYEFDRLHEGQPDIYWATAKPEGFQLRFDEAQQLDTVFLHVTSGDGFAAVSQQDSDVQFFASKLEAETFGDMRHLHVTKGATDFLGVSREWVRLGFVSHSIHYEFQVGRLVLVTISSKAEPIPDAALEPPAIADER